MIFGRMTRQAWLGVLSLAVTVVLSEFLLEKLAPVYTTGIQEAYRYDKELGITLRESVTLRRVTDHLEEIHTNRYGTADFHDDYTGFGGLIFALGDSYTQGTGLQYDQSYPAQLDLMINQDSTGGYTKRLAVVNLGLAAFGAEQSLLVMERYARTLGKPSACLYFGSDNGYEDDLLFQSGARHRHVVYGSPRWGRLVPFMIWLGQRQIVLRTKLGLMNRRDEKLDREAASQSPATIAKADSSAAELEWPAISRIVDACRARGATVVLAWTKEESPGSYEWLRAKATASSIPFNDWYPRVAAVRNTMPALPMFNPHSAGHYRGWVAREIAAGFLDQLSR
jgi:hypothetical protein